MLLVELLEGSWGSIYSLKGQLELGFGHGWCSTSQAHPSNACSSSSPTHRLPMPWGCDSFSELDSIRVPNATFGTLDMSSPWLVCFRPAGDADVPLCYRAPKWLGPKWLRTLSALWLLVCCCCCWV